MERTEYNRYSRARMAETLKARRDMQRRTRRSASTIGGAASDTIIGRAAADRAGARPYRATRCKNASRCASPDRVRERVPTALKAGQNLGEVNGFEPFSLPREQPL